MKNAHDYPLAGRATSVKLRDDVKRHAGHCAHCTAKLGRLPAVMVVLDGVGPLCDRCACYSPCGALATSMKDALVHGDPLEMIVETWRVIALQTYRENRNRFPDWLQALFDSVVSRADAENKAELDDLTAPITAAYKDYEV